MHYSFAISKITHTFAPAFHKKAPHLNKFGV